MRPRRRASNSQLPNGMLSQVRRVVPRPAANQIARHPQRLPANASVNVALAAVPNAQSKRAPTGGAYWPWLAVDRRGALSFE